MSDSNEIPSNKNKNKLTFEEKNLKLVKCVSKFHLAIRGSAIGNDEGCLLYVKLKFCEEKKNERYPFTQG